VIKPLVDALSKAIAKALEAAGVDANIAGMIGGIAGALLAAALVVAALVVGKSAAGKVASSALGDIVSTTAKKMIPDIAKNLASKAGTVVSSSMKRLLDKVGMKSNDMAMRSYSNTLGTVNNGMTFGTATVQAANGAMQGYQAKKIQDLKAAIAESSALMETIKELLLRLMDNMNSAENNQKTLWATLSDIQMDKAQTNQVILRNNYA
jgi:invasin B